jgi:hypothetical protein
MLNPKKFTTMITKIKKTIALILIAGLSGYGGSYLFNNSPENARFLLTQNSKNSISQPLQSAPARFANLAATENLPDFVKAADATVHAVCSAREDLRNSYLQSF